MRRLGAGVSRRCVGAASLMIRRKGLLETTLVFVEGVYVHFDEIIVDLELVVSGPDGAVTVVVLRAVSAMVESSVLVASASADSLQLSLCELCRRFWDVAQRNRQLGHVNVGLLGERSWMKA